MEIKALKTIVKVLKDSKEKEGLDNRDKVALDSVYNLFSNVLKDVEKASKKGKKSPVDFRLRVEI